MALLFCALVPHSPLLIPSIGKEYTERLAATRDAMMRIAEECAAHAITTLVVVTPHGKHVPERITVLVHDGSFTSHFAEFGDLAYTRTYRSAHRPAYTLTQTAQDTSLFQLSTEEVLDYGAGTPLLSIVDDASKTKIMPIRCSVQSLKEHFLFGMQCSEAFHRVSERIGVLISGELAHTHLDDPKTSKKFDAACIRILKKNEYATMAAKLPTQGDSLHACALRPLTVAAGILNGSAATFELLSYEHPFGVGLITGMWSIDGLGI